MAKFESQERRMPKIEACLKANGLESLDACREMLLSKGIDVDAIVKGVQPICFENAVWAYTLGTAIAVKRGLKSAADCAAAIGEGLEAFTIPGSVAEQRAVAVPQHPVDGNRFLKESVKIRISVTSIRASDPGQAFHRNTEQPAYLHVPCKGFNVKKLCPGGIGIVCPEFLSPGQMPYQPAVHGAAAQFSLCCQRVGVRHMLHHPAQLGG